MNRRFYCDDRTVVETAAGKIRGCFINNHYYFRGIPYATAERFMSPKPVEHWDGVLDTVTYGPVCPTLNPLKVRGRNAIAQQPLFGYRFWPEDETCQYINIWAKHLDPSAKRPVMIWVHGGGFTGGSSVEQMSYDGHYLCEDGDLVVVSFNHRLNILGFSDLSEFGEKYHNSCNIGMEDIVEVLKWVKNNIAQFGGDPDNVTLFGQSGGGGKILTLLQMPAADHLYNRVIFQSGLMYNYRTEVTDGIANRKTVRRMVEKLGLNEETIDEMQTIPLEKLRAVYHESLNELVAEGMKVDRPFGPIPNDYFLGNPIDNGFTEYGKTVPCICGSVICESILYADKFIPYTEPAEVRDAALTDLFGDAKDDMVKVWKETYPERNLWDLYNYDYYTRQGTVGFMDLKSKFDAPVYGYLMAYSFDYFGGMPSFHGADLPMVFGTTEYVDVCNEPDAVCLGQKMHQAWINFATNGDPNGGDVPEWKQYKPGECGTMVFDKKCEMRYDFDRKLVEMYDENTDFTNPFIRVRAKKD